ncbi:MAG TPA: ROK family protein [Bacteroidales bacterium]|nr:ROK family protein [Bacteroidales bacterium]HRS18187.1 ROK family protein [Bacteroidales bacterium]
MNKQITVGVDIGGTNTAIGFVDREGNCVFETSIPTKEHVEIEPYIKNLAGIIQQELTQKPEFELVGIGVGAPNANYHRGTIEEAPNLSWKGTVYFCKMLGSYFPNILVTITNDANAAAMGEMIYGAARGIRDFIVITLGTGLGSGIVVNGDLVYGHDGFAGEVGHTTVFPGGRQCGCGKKGCLETYVSATGMVRTMAEILCNSNKPSKLRDIPYNKITALDIELALKDGDELAKECFEYTGHILGLKLADAVCHTSPSHIFLFGGVAKAGNLIIEPTKRAMEENLLPIFKNKITIAQSGLLNVNAAVLGASALAWNELEK